MLVKKLLTLGAIKCHFISFHSMFISYILHIDHKQTSYIHYCTTLCSQLLVKYNNKTIEWHIKYLYDINSTKIFCFISLKYSRNDFLCKVVLFD